MAVRRSPDQQLEAILSQLGSHLPFLSAARAEALFHLSQDIGQSILEARHALSPSAKRCCLEEARAAVRRARRLLEISGEKLWPEIRRHRLIRDLEKLEDCLKLILGLLAGSRFCL